MNIVCCTCFTTNRIPENKNHQNAICGKCKKTLYSANPIELTQNNFYRFIENNDLPIIVDFWASWCAPCQNMAPIFNKVAQQSPQLLFAKVDTQQVQKVCTDANIRSLPTLIFFHQGKEIDRISGGLSEIQLKQWIMQKIKRIST
jgi:thioredoxin 2